MKNTLLKWLLYSTLFCGIVCYYPKTAFASEKMQILDLVSALKKPTVKKWQTTLTKYRDQHNPLISAHLVQPQDMPYIFFLWRNKKDPLSLYKNSARRRLETCQNNDATKTIPYSLINLPQKQKKEFAGLYKFHLTAPCNKKIFSSPETGLRVFKTDKDCLRTYVATLIHQMLTNPEFQDVLLQFKFHESFSVLEEQIPTGWFTIPSIILYPRCGAFYVKKLAALLHTYLPKATLTQEFPHIVAPRFSLMLGAEKHIWYTQGDSLGKISKWVDNIYDEKSNYVLFDKQFTGEPDANYQLK